MRRRSQVAGIGILAVAVAIGGKGLTASAEAVPAPAPPVDEYGFIDNRGPAVSAKMAAVKRVTGLPADPDAAARKYVADALGIKGALDTVAKTKIGDGTVVLLRQRFGSIEAGFEGLAAVAVHKGEVVRATSSLSPSSATPAPAKLTGADALKVAQSDGKITTDKLAQHRERLVAMPMPGGAPRAAFQVVTMSSDVEHPLGYTTYVDAVDGKVLVRENLVDFADGDARWSVFSSPPDGATDSRQTWCAVAGDGCDRVVTDPATGKAWDVDASGNSTTTTTGNSVEAGSNWAAGSGPYPPATKKADRQYSYPFTDQWNQSKCDPASLTSAARIDTDAAILNAFALHNAMHDWSYGLGFTEATWNLQRSNQGRGGKENDPELTRLQHGAANKASTGQRNNATQASPPDGQQPMSTFFMFQPYASRVASVPTVYAPCVDGAFDATFLTHEYAHTITNRMVAGPDTRLDDALQSGALNESYSDLMSMEFLFEHGYRPAGNTPYVFGAYVGGDPETGVRDYDMSKSTLNYSNIGFDFRGRPHQNGEIWNAVNFDIRKAMIDRYGAGDATQADSGNRRWMQLVFDSFLLQATGSPSMLDMRDNLIAADRMRFGGANADLLWHAFAGRGLGNDATTNGAGDGNPKPGFRDPVGANVQVTFRTDKPAKLYVGDYEYQAVAVADTDPATALPDTFSMAPGNYHFMAGGKGLGHAKFTQEITGGTATVAPAIGVNLASTASGALVQANGLNPSLLSDDDENTVSLTTGGPAKGIVTVDLPGDAPQQVGRVQLSEIGDNFNAIRSFKIQACDANCGVDASYRDIYTSPADAFPGGAFWPKPPQLALRSFSFTPATATHLRLVTLETQCTGNPQYAGEQENDPNFATDCKANTSVNISSAEFEAYAQ